MHYVSDMETRHPRSAYAQNLLLLRDARGNLLHASHIAAGGLRAVLGISQLVDASQLSLSA